MPTQAPSRLRVPVILLLASFQFAAALCSAAPPDRVGVYFQNWAVDSTYGESQATTDFKDLTHWDSGAYLRIKRYDTGNDYRGLRVKFSANAYGGDSGMTWATDMAERTEYTMEYRVYFEPGFQFNRGNSYTASGGGKLPGLAGGSRPSGGFPEDDGMSSRIMWRRNSTRDTGATGGYIELYQYWRGQVGTYGDRFYLQNVSSGSWYTIKQRVHLGSSSSDGRIRIWVNNTLRLDRNFRYLGPGQNWKLDGAMMHCFYGGNDSTWSPTASTYLILDGVIIDDDAF